MPPAPKPPASPRMMTALLTLSLGIVGGVLGCKSRNVIGAFPDSGMAGQACGASGGASGGAGGGLTGAAGTPPLASCGVPATSQIPRLTTAQYDRTIRDLLGLTALTSFGGAPPSALLVTDTTRPLSDVGLDGYMNVAEAIAAQVMAAPALRSHFLTCTPAGDGTACLHDTIVAFGRRAFRRPLTTEEVAKFDKLVSQRAQITATGAALEVAEVILGAFLSSPSFIMRSEISQTSEPTGGFVLSSHEVAARLSYLLWGSTPDELLDRAADADRLTTKEQIRAQAQRMIDDPKAREVVSIFHRTYLHRQNAYEAVDGYAWWEVRKDPARFPGFTPAVETAMSDELDRFFDDVVFAQRGSFQDLLLSARGFVNRDTAPFYGLDASRFDAKLAEVTFEPARRPGFLTRIGFLAAYAYPDRTAPSRRGNFIARAIQGLAVPTQDPVHKIVPVPPGALTTRERVEAQTAAAGCTACHARTVDPPGFALEAYDAVGASQTVEADTKTPIDTAANVLIDGAAVAVRNPADLMAKLAASRDAQQTYARRWVSYAYDRESSPLDACTVDALTGNISRTGYPVRDLVVDLTQSDAFQRRVREQP